MQSSIVILQAWSAFRIVEGALPSARLAEDVGAFGSSMSFTSSNPPRSAVASGFVTISTSELLELTREGIAELARLEREAPGVIGSSSSPSKLEPRGRFLAHAGAGLAPSLASSSVRA